jgi:hypothetical protein
MCAIRVDPWQKAEECERALERTTDLRGRELLSYLEGLWIGLANKSPFLPGDQLAEEIATVNELQADMQADLRVDMNLRLRHVRQ